MARSRCRESCTSSVSINVNEVSVPLMSISVGRPYRVWFFRINIPEHSTVHGVRQWVF